MDTVAQDQAFEYTPLESPNKIRIVKVLPGEETADIRCQMNDADLDRPPSYHALSYVWGSAEVTSPIILNNRLFFVTQNLWLALRHLRRRDSVCVMWIDAISINQLDNEERSTQVRRMKDIYSKAEEVIIWLGPEANDSTLALELAARVDQYWFQQAQVLGRPESAIMSISRDDLSTEITPYGGSDNHRALKAFSLLLSRPWWERVWVIQEATTPGKSKIVQCGNNIIRWDALVTASKFISSLTLRPDLKEEFERVPPINQLSNRRLFNMESLRKAGQYSNDLLATLADFRHHKATDPRDMVYALLGFLEETVVAELAPDYSLNSSLVYENAAKLCILERGTLDCLGYCFFPQRDPSLPSWVPAWNNQGPGHPLAKHTARRYQGSSVSSVYNAAGTYAVALDAASFLGHKLVLKGLCVDKVKSAGRPYDKVLHNEKDDILMDWMPNAPEDKYEHTGETRILAYCRTLVADVAKEGSKRTRGFAIDWKYWREAKSLGEPPPGGERRIEWGSLLYTTVGRCFIWSDKGYMGLAPSDARPGDFICILLGGQVLYVLRQRGEGFHFIGECYVHGLMDGEAMRLSSNCSFEWQTLVIE
jgi:hypothetical protein